MMSKWIKLEDAINDLDDLLDYLFADDIKTPTALKQVKADLLNLPTIEINEYANKDEAFMKGYAKGSIEGYIEGRASVEVSKDCISREQAIEAIGEVDWYHINRVGELVHGAASDETALYRAEDIYKAIESLPSVVSNVASKDHSGETTEMVDERCRGCKHYRLTCDMFSEICKYEPITEQSSKVGEWIMQGISPYEGIQRCSLCDEIYNITEEFNYCPNCGAKMKGA